MRSNHLGKRITNRCLFPFINTPVNIYRLLKHHPWLLLAVWSNVTKPKRIAEFGIKRLDIWYRESTPLAPGTTVAVARVRVSNCGPLLFLLLDMASSAMMDVQQQGDAGPLDAANHPTTHGINSKVRKQDSRRPTGTFRREREIPCERFLLRLSVSIGGAV